MTTFLRIPCTLSINAMRCKNWFVTEIDCDLEVDFDSPEDWAVTAVTFTKYGNTPEFTVDAKSDPLLWQILGRAIEDDDMAIADAVMEAAAQDRMDRAADAADHLRDLMQDR